MKLGNHLIHFTSHARWPITKVWTSKSYGERRIGWYKFVLSYHEVAYCEICEKELKDNSAMCDECYELHYCECGARLEDSYGSPGDGFCTRCR